MTSPRFPTKAEFMAWRKKHPKAGTHQIGYCPIALFLTERGVERPRVYGDRWSFGQFEPSVELPKWAREFIRRFDTGERV